MKNGSLGQSSILPTKNVIEMVLCIRNDNVYHFHVDRYQFCKCILSFSNVATLMQFLYFFGIFSTLICHVIRRTTFSVDESFVKRVSIKRNFMQIKPHKSLENCVHKCSGISNLSVK